MPFLKNGLLYLTEVAVVTESHRQIGILDVLGLLNEHVKVNFIIRKPQSTSELMTWPCGSWNLCVAALVITKLDFSVHFLPSRVWFRES